MKQLSTGEKNILKLLEYLTTKGDQDNGKSNF